MVNKIEVLKQAKDGLDVYPDLVRYAWEGHAAIEPDDFERLKWYGLFHRKATPGYFMLRLRIPNGVLTSEQIAAVGEIANRCGRGQADITTRQNIQLRWIEVEDVPWIFQRLSAAGLTSQQSGMDNVRNVVGCPVAGLDPDELIDSRALAVRLQQAIIGHRAFSNLPRKFNLAITGCRDDCIHARTHDLSFVPALIGDQQTAGFNVLVGGAMGGREPAYAQPLDVFIEARDVVPLATAILEVFRDHGPRESRRASRLKVLLKEWGMERFRKAVVERFGRPLAWAGDPATGRDGGDHIGVTGQAQAGQSVVGCLVPVGRITGDQLIEFGRLASKYGEGELRLTVQQNVLIPHVNETRLGTLLAEPLLETFSPDPSPWMRSVVTCTGTEYCHFSLIDTKGEALKLARALDERYEIDAPVRLQMSGCPHACGQHRAGEVGLLGSRVRRGETIVDAADLFVGGSLGEDATLGERVNTGVLIDDLPGTVAESLRALRGGQAVRDRDSAPEAAG